MSIHTVDALSTFSDLASQAHDSALSVRLEPAEFIKLERACQNFRERIDRIQRRVVVAGDLSVDWGLGEKNPRLTSAQILVARFAGLASDREGNSAFAVLQEHLQVVTQIEEMFRSIRENYMRTDDEFAAAVLAIDPTLTVREEPTR